MTLRLFHGLIHCGLVTPLATLVYVKIGSGNGLLPYGTKPFPETMLKLHDMDEFPLVQYQGESPSKYCV